MNPDKELREKGEFSKLAALMRVSSEEFIERLGAVPGLNMLDLPCGDGATALPMARLGAEALGEGIARNLVAAAQAREAREGLTLSCRIVECDACDLSELPDNNLHRDAPPSRLTETFITSYGPVMRVFEHQGNVPRPDELRSRMTEMMERENRGRDGMTDIGARYLVVTVKVPQTTEGGFALSLSVSVSVSVSLRP